MQAAKRAIATLDAFQFDTTFVREQFRHLQDGDG
jgi:hypothetical protein